MASLFLGLYALFAVLQYLAAYMISFKPLIQLGPIRLSMLGYWFVACVAIRYIRDRSIGRLDTQHTSVQHAPEVSKYAVPTAILVLATGLTQIKDGVTYAKAPAEAEGLLAWATAHTSPLSTFAVPFGALTGVLPFNAGRAVYGGTGFPFVESKMVEYCLRDQLLYGTPAERNQQPGSWIGEKMAEIYRKRTPENFAAMTELAALDYVVLERSKTGPHWDVLIPDYRDDRWLVFNATQIKQRFAGVMPQGVTESPCKVQSFQDSDPRK